MKSTEEKYQQYLALGVSPYYQKPLVFVEGEGRHVTNARGHRYLDFFGGILTVSVGQAHPVVTSAIARQFSRLLHTSALYVTESTVRLAERLALLTSGALQQSSFTTSGTEANETAIIWHRSPRNRGSAAQLLGPVPSGYGLNGPSRMETGRGGNGFFYPPIHHAHNAYCYRCSFAKTPDRCGLDCARDMEEFIRTSTLGTAHRLFNRTDSGSRRVYCPVFGIFSRNGYP